MKRKSMEYGQIMYDGSIDSQIAQELVWGWRAKTSLAELSCAVWLIGGRYEP